MTDPFSRTYCGDVDLSACRDALPDTDGEAATVGGPDGCEVASINGEPAINAGNGAIGAAELQLRRR